MRSLTTAARMIRRHDRDPLHRYYRVPDGTHVDGLHAEYGDRVRPLLPCARRAFLRMTAWVERDRRPPTSATLTRPREGADTVNRCSLH